MKKVLQLLFLFCTSIAFAQDIHWSQYNSSPLNLNPAQTGLFDGDWRFVGNYRNQWSVIPVPYNTYSVSADTRLKTDLLKNGDVPGVGIIINSDKAGDSKFTTNQILLSGSYIKKLKKDSTQFASFGIQPGITTRNFNVNALTFDSQYDGDSYDPTLPNGENFAKTRITYFDLGVGGAYHWRRTNRTWLNAGISLQHLTMPKQSFFNNDQIKLDIKTNVSGLASIQLTDKGDVMPSFLYQRQGKFQETLVGVFGKYHLAPIDGKNTAIALGAFYRVKDAFIVAANMDYKNFNVGVSYDVNISKLTEATNNRGGFELSIIYIFKKIVPFVAKTRVCPLYM